jgi:hypothetical protein
MSLRVFENTVLRRIFGPKSFLPFGATAEGEIWPPEQSASILLDFLSLSFYGDHHVHPSEADYLVSEQFSFYGVRLLASRPTANLEDQDVRLRLAPSP